MKLQIQLPLLMMAATLFASCPQAQTSPAAKRLLALGEEKGYRHEAVSHAMATIERLDPTSLLLGRLRELTPESSRRYAEAVNETQTRLLQALGSPDPQVREAAVAELAKWARSHPTNSTHVMNYAFGLRAIGLDAQAQQLALTAIARSAACRTFAEGSVTSGAAAAIVFSPNQPQRRW